MLPSISGDKRKNSTDSLTNHLGDSEMSGGEEKKGEVHSRSNHQRLKAIEIFSSLIKSSQKNANLLKTLTDNLGAINSVINTVLKTSNSW